VAIDDRSNPSDIAGAVRFFVFSAEPDPERLMKVEGDAPVPLPPPVGDVDEAIQRLYLDLLSRAPSPEELQIAKQFFASDANSKPNLEPAAMEDFLWSMLLHPDFQYVY
jgi:hypothetical protein